MRHLSTVMSSLADTSAITINTSSSVASETIQDVTRFIRTTTSAAGLFQQMYHVGDDPERFGVDPDLRRQHETTTTTWLMLIQE